MEQQPVRRRRRRRRSRRAARESVAWLTYLLNLIGRAYHWAVLCVILGVILLLGMGAPLGSFDTILSFWSHW